MYDIIINIIAWIAIIWFVSIMLVNIFLYVYYYLAKDDNFVCITRDTSFYVNSTEWYILPSIEFCPALKESSWTNINIYWLKWVFSISYHIKTEKEEEIECMVRKELNNKT